MALSGSTNYSQNAGTIIRDALIKLGVATPNSTIADSTNNMCLRALNDLIKDWQQDGIHLWTQHEGVIVFDYGVASYTFPDADLAGASVGVVREEVLEQTTIGTAGSTSDTAIALASTSGMAATDKILIELDDGTRHDSTIVSVDSATQVTITDGLASATDVGNYVWSYPVAETQTNKFFPRQITNVRIRDSSGYDRSLSEFARDEYYLLPNKSDTGFSTGYYLDNQMVNKVIYLYPAANSIRDSLRFTYSKALDDVDAFTNDIEFPPEWNKAIKLMLAVDLAVNFGREDKLKVLLPLAQEAYQRALAFDDDKVDIQITPDFGM